ncbi:MAG TPA: DUF3352 domain-containing protein [Anaerolineae bacterium]|nr:DUF3352 domain-containing protein [Anaerolineae bacterium]
MSMNELESPAPQKGNRLLVAGLGAGLLIVVLLVLGVFAWRALGTASVASAQAMPEDTVMYVSIDFVNLLDPAQANRLLKAVEPILEESDVEARSLEESLAELDKNLQEEISLTFTGDIQPWLGRSMGIGILDLDLANVNNPEIPTILIAIESRDEEAAQAFANKLIDSLREKNEGLTFAAAEYNGDSYQTGSLNDSTWSIGVTNDLFLFGVGKSDILPQAFDAQKGGSLLDTASYQQVLGQLPADRTMTFYMGGSKLQEMYAEMLADADLPPTMDPAKMGVEAVQAFGGSFGMSAAGLQIDSIGTYDDSKFTAEQKALMEASAGVGESVAIMPDSTVAYIANAGFSAMWPTIKSMVADLGTEEEFNESMTMATDLLGFSIEDDLIPALGNEMVIGVTKDETGFLSEMAQAPLGLVFVHSVADGAKMKEIVGSLQGTLEAQGAPPISSVNQNGVDFYQIEDSGTTMLVYGSSDEYMVIGSSLAVADAIYQSENRLKDTASFQAVEQALGRGMRVLAYVNVVEAVSMLPESEQDPRFMQLANNFDTLAMGGQYEDNMFKARAILFVE